MFCQAAHLEGGLRRQDALYVRINTATFDFIIVINVIISVENITHITHVSWLFTLQPFCFDHYGLQQQSWARIDLQASILSIIFIGASKFKKTSISLNVITSIYKSLHVVIVVIVIIIVQLT